MKRAIDLALFMTDGTGTTSAPVADAPASAAPGSDATVETAPIEPGSETVADVPGESTLDVVPTGSLTVTGKDEVLSAQDAADNVNLFDDIIPETTELEIAQKKLDNYLKEVEGYIVDYEDVNDPYVKEINRLKEEVAKALKDAELGAPEPEAAEPPVISEEEKNNIKNQIDNARVDFEEKSNTVDSKKGELKDLDNENNVLNDPLYVAEEGVDIESERERVRKELEQANKELKLSEIFATMVDGLGGSTEDKVPIVKEYNETLSTTNNMTEKISLAIGFTEKIKSVKKLKQKGELAKKFKKNTEDSQKQSQEDIQIQSPEDIQIQSPEDTQDPFNDIDDNNESLTNNNIPITTTNNEQDLSAKTLGEKIANKISNYFSLKEVRKRREDRKLSFNTIKSNVRKFVFKKLHFEKVVNKVEKIKKKIKRKVKDLKKAASTFIKNKINLKKLIIRGKEIVQNIAKKIGKSIDNAKLYFTDRVGYYEEKYNTKQAEYNKKIGELTGKKDAIETKLNNAIGTTITEECLTSENLSLKEDKDKLTNKIEKKGREKEEKLKKISAQKAAAQETALEKETIAGVKQEIENITNNVDTKKLKENIKRLKKERRKLKFENVKLKIAEKFCEKLGFKVENEKNEKVLNEQRINNNQFKLGIKQETLKKARKAKLQKTFSNDKTKLEQTLKNLKQANETLQSSVEVSNSNSLGV